MARNCIIEILPQKACFEAKKSCSFLVENGIWPKFLNCEDHVPETFSKNPLLKRDEYKYEKLNLFNEDCDVILLFEFFNLNNCIFR